MAVEIIDLLQLAFEQKRRKGYLIRRICMHGCITIQIPAKGMTCTVTTPIRRFMSSKVNARCISLTVVRQ
jgi:hypothetical protein